MLDQKDGHGQYQGTVQMSRMGNMHLTGSLEKKSSSRSQQVSSIGGYTIPGESTWSQNLDSAASMFPQTPIWEEEFQDLSSYCQKPEQNMSSGKESGTKNSSCIVPDDELNTPEICIPEFDFSRRNVLSRDETSPVSLFGGEIWDTPITNEKIGDGATPDVKNIQSNEIVSDQNAIPSVIHEEEVVSNETVIMFDEPVNEQMDIDMLSQNNLYVIVDKNEATTEINEDDENVKTASVRYLESLITQISNAPDNTFTDIDVEEIKIETDPYYSESDLNCCEQPVQENMVNNSTMETVPAPQQRPPKEKSNLSLNLAGLFTADDQISTPVIVESLLGVEGETLTFEKLMDFVQGESLQDETVATPPSTSTVDFSVLASSSSKQLSDNAIKKEPDLPGKTLNVQIVKPVTIKKTSNGNFCVADKINTLDVDNRQFGKKIVMNRTTKKISSQKAGSVHMTNITNKERKMSEKGAVAPKPRGRPPREPTPSTSRGGYTRPKRQRKVIEVSDYDDEDDEIMSQPSSKRSRLSSIESDGDKYREHRDKNNEASRRSRFNRKVREQEMKETKERLERDNQSLRIKAEEMEKLVKRLREELLEVVTKGKKTQ